ncbi:non-ribosomal peptide synthetase [Legionella bononiensis]|uniref:Amino acid adenylation domain-containing protein n=1 Tax=Legionella bononiensis TaxID=2793102 RepID=A0ABS1WFW6_9GAMM|nr:non-ribosomal peptide synthetase [Legionella bononiensis]MBL7481681.1 amino acid adenylation domain-containing protein [Legionella bononiensis]MBL7528229.1 amino acid adenylation domain-containing protein [Legionella bononiensis]MBL7562704.1 amino acid adenylation domain-containing protein [Legionella bononiensis]
MMTVDDFFRALKKEHILLTEQDGKLICHVRKGCDLVPEYRLFLKQNKEEILKKLKHLSNSNSTKKMYGLTPLQEGLLFHSLDSSNDLSLYCQQKCWEIEHNIDLHVFKKAWQILFDRYDVLRTRFIWQQLDRPQQEIVDEVELPWFEYDIKDTSADLDTFLANDWRAGFDLMQAPLIRLILIKVNGKPCRFVFTHHHLILDGWSSTLLFQELEALYSEGVSGELSHVHSSGPSHSSLVGWLEKQDSRAGLQFWKEHLRGFAEANSLPVRLNQEVITRTLGTKQASIFEHRLDPVFSKACVEFARNNGITINALMQFSWGLLLSIYSGSNDVLFGMVSSGRTATIDDAEHIIGMCINTLPFRVKITARLSVFEHLKQVHIDIQKANMYGFLKLVDLRKYTELEAGVDFFSSLFLFENYPGRKKALSDATPWHNRTIQEKTNVPVTLQVFDELDQCLWLKLQLAPDISFQLNGKRLLYHYEGVLNWIIQHIDKSPSECDYLSEEERIKILRWSQGPVKERDKTVLSIYYANPCFNSDKILLEHDGLPLSFAAFEALTNQWANLLHSNYQVTQGDAIAFLLTEPSAAVVLMFSILKLGAHYVPLHQDWPIARQQKAVIDAGVTLWITDANATLSSKELPAAITLCSYAEEVPHLEHYSKDFKADSITPHELVYTIYTSGTTGVPKGASVYHQSVSNVIRWCEETTPIELDSKFLIISSFSFDLTQKNILTPICLGAELHFLPEGHFDILAILTIIESKKITHLTCTPSVFRLLLDEAEADNFQCMSSLKHIVFGGEKLQLPKLAAWMASGFYAANLHNSYGPTECTDIVTCFTLPSGSSLSEVPREFSIGTPVPNLKVYILSKENRLEGIGVPGELCIGGMGVGCGYRSDKELTQQRFVSNPIDRAERIYHTGDWGIWREDGLIHFLGRKDAQIKYHGHRIDLTEIERVLNNQPELKQSAIALQGDEGKEKIIAYCVPLNIDEPINTEFLRTQLLQELPQYMIPHVFIELTEIPLTHNGKLNRAALPLLDREVFELQEDFVAPVTQEEQQLAQIWAEVLGQSQIGINDNFFSLGGDSILGIQVVAKARTLGLSFEAHNLFQYPTVYELAKIAHQSKALIIDQGLASGTFPLSPPQAWFLSKQPDNPSHFNQSFLFKFKKTVAQNSLEVALKELVNHHDALRLRLRKGHQTTDVTFYDAQDHAFAPFLHQVKVQKEQDIEDVCDSYQASLDIEQGPVMVAVLIEGPEPKDMRLFLAINHFVVDTVSWRIILEDFQALIEQLEMKKTISLPKKTSSYRSWVEGLQQAANSTLQNELPYWEKICSGYRPVPVELNPDYFPKRHETELVHISWTKEQTQNLLTQAHVAYNTRMNDLLLAALSLAFWRWQHIEQLWFNLEGHGREPITPDVDISRTVGWFTSFFPQKLTFKTDCSDNYAEIIKSIKEQIRKVPNQGAGFGPLWCYLNECTLNIACNVSFNYLGQLDSSFNEGWLLSLASENKGRERSQNHRSPFQLDLNAAILDHQFTMRVRYSPKNYREESVRHFAELFNVSLDQLVAHCLAQSSSTKTPSDFNQINITQDTIDKLSKNGGMEHAFPLTPLQEGMLFHSVSSPGDDVYCTQVCMKFSAEDFNSIDFKQAWEQLVEKYDVFRTRFVWEDVERPFQVVYAARKLKWNEFDWQEYTEVKIEELYQEFLYKDRQQGFDFTQDGLYRISLIRFSENTFACVFTHHHLLLDGWSISLLIDEVVKKYINANNSKKNGSKVASYGSFVTVFYQTNKEECKEFWHDYLRGFDQTTTLGFANNALDVHKQIKSVSRLSTHLDGALSDKCRQCAKAAHVSLSTFMEYTWAVLLYLYNGERDIVLGNVSSIRHLEGMTHSEYMVGLFIATLPKRISLKLNQPIIEQLHELNLMSQKLVKYSNVSLKEIQQETALDPKASLFSSLFAFENYPINTAWVKHDRFHLLEKKTYEKNNYPFTLFVIPKAEVELRFVWDGECFDKVAIERVSRRYKNLLGIFIESDSSQSLDHLLYQFFKHEDLAYHQPPSVQFMDVERNDISLSYHQERLRFIDQFETGIVYDLAPSYHNIPIVVQFFADLDLGKLHRVVEAVLKKHAVLRGIFTEEDGQNCFRILDVQEAIEGINFNVQQMSHLNLEEILAVVAKDANKPFAIDEHRLRVDIYLQQEQHFILVLTVHHSVCDFQSTRILADEIGDCYLNLATEQASSTLAFMDFSLWQRHLSSELIDRLFFYWRWQLALPLQALKLPEDHSRPPVHRYSQSKISAEISPDLLLGVQQVALNSNVSEEEVFLGSLQVVLAQYSSTNEVVVGREHDNRICSDLAYTIGPLGNLTVIRSILERHDELKTHFFKLKQLCDLADLYSGLPFDQLVKMVNPEKDMSRTALFDVLFKYMQSEGDEANLTPNSYKHLVNYLGYGKYDYVFFIKAGSSCSAIDVIYNRDIYDEESARQLLRHYIALLQNLPRLLYERIEDIDLLSEEEKRIQLEVWNRPDINFPKTLTIVQRFEEMVCLYPHHIALRFDQNEMTYDDLNRMTNQLSDYLKHHGVGREMLVGLLMPRSMDMIVVILAVLKTGAAYLPLDVHAPERRNQYIIDNSKVQYLISGLLNSEQLIEHVAHVLDWNCIKQELHLYSQENPGSDLKSSDAAYCIYTSGTTGVPKGVTISHQNVIRLFLNDEALFPFSATDRWLQFHSYHFDFSVWEIFGGLLFGGCIVLVAKDDTLNPSRILELLRMERISVLNQTPTAFFSLSQEVVAQDYPSLDALRMVIFGGEKLDTRYLLEWVTKYQHMKMINMYGITETTVHVSYKEIQLEDILHNRSNIGKSIPTTLMYIMDQHQNLLPPGVQGEIYVGGAGLGYGYLYNETLTAERFINHPYRIGERLYRSGDRGKLLLNGEVIYHGRNDNQVNIRGFRIELGEIETCLSKIPGITHAVVLVDYSIVMTPKIIAYYVADKIMHSADIFSQLRDFLPHYMIPAYLIQVPRIPLTVQGKVDKAALPSPTDLKNDELHRSEPQTEVEVILAQIWENVLSRESIYLEDNFFDLGGDSILIIVAISKAREKGIYLTPKDFFIASTLKDLVNLASFHQKQIGARPIPSDPFPLSPIQHWFFARDLAQPNHYNQSVLLRANDSIHAEFLQQALIELVRYHDALRIRFSDDKKGQWKQTYQNKVTTQDIPLFVLKPCGPSGGWEEGELQAAFTQLQAGLNIQNGPLISAALVPMAEGTKDLLFLVIHHLVVDTVSWHLIINDLELIYKAKLAGVDADLPSKTSSFYDWVLALETYKNSWSCKLQNNFWHSIVQSDKLLKSREEKNNQLQYSAASCSLSLGKKVTQTLGKALAKRSDISIDDIIFVAVYNACQSTLDDEFICYKEGHGRVGDLLGVDLTRTVGWFTSLYPIMAGAPVANHDENQSRTNLLLWLQRKRLIPDEGIGYGLIRYGGTHEEVFEPSQKYRIGINFLGRHEITRQKALFSQSDLACGVESSSQNHRFFDVNINGWIGSNGLELKIAYDANTFGADSVRYFTNILRNTLHDIEQTLKQIPSDSVQLNQVTLGSQPQFKPVLSWSEEATNTPLFLFPPLLGGAETYIELANRLGSDRPIYSLESYNLHSGYSSVSDLSELARFYSAVILAILQDFPAHNKICLGGWSMGGLLAWEVAHQLAKKSIVIEKLYLVDTPVHLANHFFNASEIAFERYLSQLMDIAKMNESLKEKYYKVYESERIAIANYSIQPNECDVVLFAAQASYGDLHEGWSQFARKVEFYDVPGSHFDIMKDDNLEKIASVINGHVKQKD